MDGQKTFFGLARRSFAFWFGGIWLLCGAPFLIIGLYLGIDEWQLADRFKREAQVTDGMVLTKRIRRERNGSSPSYWVGYRFAAANGAVVKSEAQVSVQLWDRLAEREPVRVTYLPDRPQANRIEGEHSGWLPPLIFTGLGVVFVPIGGWIFLKGVAGIRRELRLESQGVTGEATVVEVAPANMSINGVPQWRIRYRFRDYGGNTREAQSSLMPPGEAQAWKAGDRGKARFDPANPRISVWVGKA